MFLPPASWPMASGQSSHLSLHWSAGWSVMAPHVSSPPDQWSVANMVIGQSPSTGHCTGQSWLLMCPHLLPSGQWPVVSGQSPLHRPLHWSAMAPHVSSPPGQWSMASGQWSVPPLVVSWVVRQELQECSSLLPSGQFPLLMVPRRHWSRHGGLLASHWSSQVGRLLGVL